jgi:Ca2+:H+ antiporter
MRATSAYLAYLAFQLWSHKNLYNKKSSTGVAKAIPWKVLRPTDVEAGPPASAEDENPKTSWPVCLGTLLVVTVLIGVTSEFLVSSIDGLIKSTGLSKEFVGLIGV